jgi:hypothetical protein
MTNPRDMESPEETRLLQLLGEGLAQADPVPDWVRRGAADSVSWARLDAELAELVFDSALEDVAGVRSTGTARLLSFRAPGIEFEMSVEQGVRRLIGQVVPAQEIELELRTPYGTSTVRTDALGRFTIEELPEGPISLRCDTGDGVVQTQWMVF